MARRKSKKTKNPVLLILAVVIALLLGIFGVEDEQGKYTKTYYGEGEVYVHFIDVGQGSATLIQDERQGILIDSGEKEYSQILSTYITSCGVERLEYVVASHPHSDHIGGMTDIFEDFEVGAVLMPELSSKNMPTTRLYEDFLTYIDEKDMSVEFPEAGDVYTMGDASLTVLGPVEQVKDLNDMSLICKVKACNTDIMLPADAENQELSSVFEDVSADFSSEIIAMAHHGSSSSVHEDFLDAVDADVAIISCGKNNSYNHPHREALDYIEDNSMELYRTDFDGDIVFRCDAEGYDRVE